jgi:type 2 lantibiotic biosynthesis protein LanM
MKRSGFSPGLGGESTDFGASGLLGKPDVCTKIAAELRQHAVPCKDGSVTWLSTKQSETGAAVPLGPHLYGGTSGIALFLAALYLMTGQEEHRSLALQTISSLRQKLADLTDDPGRARGLHLGVGGMIGLGSFLYALVRIGGWLNDPSLLEQALDASLLFSAERIEADDSLDIVHGSSGALLALLALDGALPQANAAGTTPLELAVQCGHHLLARRVSWDGGPRAWPPRPGLAPLSGFAHGAAGICYALTRLYARTHSPEILDAVEEGLAFERRIFSQEHGNWRDLRRPEPRFMTAWCHGAPGIALGRLGMLDVIDDAEIRLEIHTGLETTRRLVFEELDHLCCGNCGRAEILDYAARRLDEPAYHEDGRALLEQVLARSEERGGFFVVRPNGEPAFEPSLLRGISGIGLSLLRWADPETLPSPLLLQ